MGIDENFLVFSDINECETNNGGCTQGCDNTVGGFMCFCNSGLTLQPDGRTCSASGNYFVHCAVVREVNVSMICSISRNNCSYFFDITRQWYCCLHYLNWNIL